MKIIIVDDDMTSLTCFLKNLVNEYDIEYKFFKGDLSCILSYLRANRIDGIFLSLKLDNRNGVDVAKQILSLQKDIKIVFMGEEQVAKQFFMEFKENVLGVCEKPLIVDQIQSYIDVLKSSVSKKISIKTFGSFDVFINQKIIKFISAKAKELFALLITYNGRSLNMSDAICHLWPDKAVELAKRLYRDAIWKLRKTLKEYQILFVVEFKRAQLFLHKQNIECDYWEYLLKPSLAYNGIFLPSYDWSIEFQSELDTIKIKSEHFFTI